MAYWPITDVGPIGLEVGTLASSTPPVVTATAGAANVKGSWVQLEASTATAWSGFWILLPNTGAATTNTSTLMDIGFGAAASEVVQVSNYPIGYLASAVQSATSVSFHAVYVPLYVPSGVRIAARVQSAVASKNVLLRIIGQPYRGGLHGIQAAATATTYGSSTANSRAVTVTASASANTLGAWTELTASTTARTDSMLLAIQGNASTAISNSGVNIQVGVGGSGAEAMVAESWFSASTSEMIVPAPPLILTPATGLDIPSGSRLVARLASSVASQAFDVAAICFSY